MVWSPREVFNRFIKGPVINSGERGATKRQGGGGGKSCFTPTKKSRGGGSCFSRAGGRGGGGGGGKENKIWGSFNTGASSLSHAERGRNKFAFFKRGRKRFYPVLEGDSGWRGVKYV